MNKTIYVVVREMTEADDFQLVQVLQLRAFTVEADADNWCKKLNKDFGSVGPTAYIVVPLELE